MKEFVIYRDRLDRKKYAVLKQLWESDGEFVWEDEEGMHLTLFPDQFNTFAERFEALGVDMTRFREKYGVCQA